MQLLSSDPEEHYPTPVARDLQRYQMAEFEAQKQARQEAARKAFEGMWIRATETDLKECCQRYQASDEPSIRSNLKAFIQLLCENLKDHHMSLGTFDTAEAIVERKRVCTALGLE